MIQADVPALAAELVARGQRFAQRLARNESPRKAIFHAAAGDGVGDAALARQPEDEIANEHGHPCRIRGKENKSTGGRRQSDPENHLYDGPGRGFDTVPGLPQLRPVMRVILKVPGTMSALLFPKMPPGRKIL